MLTDFRGLPLPHSAPSSRRQAASIPATQFGKGSLHEFSWYFEGESSVSVLTLDEVLDWLLGCEYHSDHALFLEEDFWQHPVTFEALRKGDCAAHAMWAWRKLCELGYEVEFVVGKTKDVLSAEVQAEGQGHAWLTLKDKSSGEEYVLESTAKKRGRMLMAREETLLRYFPRYSVNQKLQTFRHSIP